MSVIYEEGPEEIAAREADEAAHRLLVDRLREGERQAAAARREEFGRIADALDLIDSADPMLIAEVRAQRAVRGTRLVEQRVAAPALGGQTPVNMARIAREEASAARAHQNDLQARARWLEDSEETIRNLCAGQSEESQRLIRAQFRAQKAR